MITTLVPEEGNIDDYRPTLTIMKKESGYGTFYSVGVGPGDPRLMTYLAVETVCACPVIAVMMHGSERGAAYQIAKGMIEDLDAKECIEFHVPMSKDPTVLSEAYQCAATNIMKTLREGKDVACLTLGDPTIYSSAIYLHRIVKENGFSTEIISGVPSFCAAAAKLGDSLVDRAEELHVIPSSYGDALEKAVKLPGTKVFMKAGAKIRSVKEALQTESMQSKMVENCGMQDEKIYPCLEDIPEKASYYSLIVMKEQGPLPEGK